MLTFESMGVPSSELSGTSGLSAMPKHILQQIELLSIVFSDNFFSIAQAPPKSFTKVPIVDTFFYCCKQTPSRNIYKEGTFILAQKVLGCPAHSHLVSCSWA